VAAVDLASGKQEKVTVNDAKSLSDIEKK